MVSVNTSLKIVFVFARPSKENISLILTWNNDPVNMEFSLYKETRLLDEFSLYYIDLYKQAPIKPRFACINEEYVGVVSFARYNDPSINHNRQVKVYICSSPLYRKKGYNTDILIKASEIAVGLGFDALIAHVKEENYTTIKELERAGFHFLDKNIEKIKTGTKEDIIPILRFLKA